MGYIYKITNNMNDKIYIGKTELSNPEDRWKEHLQDYKKDRCERRPLYEAMKKYGTEHFRFEVIEETDDTCKREQFWIEKLRTYIGFEDCNGYNATLGGDGKSYLNLDEDEVIRYHTEEAMFRLGATAKYFKVDRRSIKNILEKNNITWCDKGMHHRIDAFIKHGCLVQLDKDSKMVINRFINPEEAAKELNVKENAIRNACKYSTSHLSYGFLWYYQKDLDKLEIDIIDIASI